MPTPDQVRHTPLLARVTVPPEWEDLNGHVNVKHHLGMYDRGTAAVMEMLGVSVEWVKRERTGIFDLEHHIWFQNEVHVGDQVALHIRFTERNAKRVVGLVFLLNETRGELASVIEFLSTSADLDARRIVPFPGVVADRLDDWIAQHAALAWPAPRSGAITV